MKILILNYKPRLHISVFLTECVTENSRWIYILSLKPSRVFKFPTHTLYSLIMNSQDLIHNTDTLLGEKEGRMSRVNLFYTEASLHAARLYPAHTHDGKEFYRYISCVTGNIKTGTTDKKWTKKNYWTRKKINPMTEQTHWLSDPHFFALMYWVAPCGAAPLLWVMTKYRKWCE